MHTYIHAYALASFHYGLRVWAFFVSMFLLLKRSTSSNISQNLQIPDFLAAQTNVVYEPARRARARVARVRDNPPTNL